MTTTGRISVRKNQNAGSTLPEVGKIKIGEKKTTTSGKEYPSSLDYFRATGTFAGEFQKLFGDKPKKLSISFISDDLSEVCNERFECWDKGKKWGWGDGETFTIYDESEKKYVENVPATDPRVKKLNWALVLTMRFVLLGMRGIMGYWTFQTKAKASTIPSAVKAFDWVREKAGTIIGFPFSLIVEKKTGYSPGEAKSYPVVSLVPNFSENAIEEVQNYLEQGGNINKLNTKFIQSVDAVKQLSAAPEPPTVEATVVTPTTLFDEEQP